ncbi:DUF6541 family protein [Geodermatophilus sp. DSM 44513]|uniref:DUF6541 family protein n=1 Tax=Geodermatophilus sp. DSM 44513 TaxID=1528104 RepID=UPI0028F6C245|nr:DUF6541 family protein [Geodermatophilus sp. DSM 44513]WNV74788.1 DUF6541 family protein [Geodermatophilus sp. DSM 44513]
MLSDLLVVLPVSLLVLFLPGGAVAAAAGLRAPVALAVAPLLSYGLAAAAATAAAVVDVDWGPGALLVTTAVPAALLWLVRHPRPGRWRPRRPVLRRPGVPGLVTGAGVLAGGVLSAAVLLAGMGSVTRPNQDWDFTFHANATRLIADTGQVAASALREVNHWETEAFFYPNAHAALGAVVRDLTGASVFAVLNTSALLVGGLAGLGLAVLLRDLGAPLGVRAATPLLLAGCTAFPYDLLWRGPLLPYATGVALLPAFLLLVRGVAGRRPAAPVLLTALGAAALFGLQPSTALAAALLTALMVGQGWWDAGRVRLREAGLLLAAAALTAVLAAPAVLGALRAGTGEVVASWRAVATPWEATTDLLLFDHATPGPPQYALALAVLVGLGTLRSARWLWWWVAATAVAGVLFVLTASSDAPLVEAVTRPWWNDRWRFAALAALGTAPVAAHGVRSVARGAVALAARARPAPGAVWSRPASRAVAVGAVLGVLVLATGGLYWQTNRDRTATAYASERHLSRAETAAMAWLAERVPPGDFVMNDPMDGSAHLLSVTGVRPVFGHHVPSNAALGPVQGVLLSRFACLDSDPAVRDAVAQLGIRYVLVGSGFVRPTAHRAPGLRQLSASPSLRLVRDEGGVRLYEVDLRPPADSPVEGCTRPAG